MAGSSAAEGKCNRIRKGGRGDGSMMEPGDRYVRTGFTSENRLHRQTFRTSEVTVCGLSAALICVGAFLRITLPVEPYPMHFSLQWFFVLMTAILFGRRLGTVSTAVYLMMGLCGLPVFASGGGLSYLFKPTFGFLLGFLPAAWVTGTLACRGRRSFRQSSLAGTCGLFVYYGVGMLYYGLIGTFLYHYSGLLRTVLVNCCLLTIGGDFLLCLLAAAAAQRIRGRLRGTHQR